MKSNASSGESVADRQSQIWEKGLKAFAILPK
jgi:hypothetical protein